jgi:hypothetical protein
MANTLTTPGALTDLPGAPFADVTVDAAVAQIRFDAGWHIAPVVTDEVLVLDGVRGRELVLPSRKVVTVTQVRDLTDPDAPVVMIGWRLIPGQILVHDAWPCEEATIEVTLTHGYTECPADLLPLIAAMASASALDTTRTRQKAGAFEVEQTNLSTLAAYAESLRSALDPYRARMGF